MNNGTLIIIEQNQATLKKELSRYRDYAIDVFGGKEERFEKFRSNLAELGLNTYLMKEVQPKHIIKLAIDLSVQGFNINPKANQLSIVPFTQKGISGKVPQPIIHLKGWQEVLYSGDFMLTVSNVWELDSEELIESEMTFKKLKQIDETNEKFRDEHFLGFIVKVEDLTKKLPLQSKFVSYQYTKKATKNMDTPKEFLLEGLVHKAIRKALKTMVIPQSRVFLVNEEEVRVEEEQKTVSQPPITTNNPMEILNQSNHKTEEKTTTIDVEEVDELTEEELIQKLKGVYKEAEDADDKALIMKAVQYQGDDRLDVLKEECERLGLC